MSNEYGPVNIPLIKEFRHRNFIKEFNFCSDRDVWAAKGCDATFKICMKPKKKMTSDSKYS